MTVFSQLMDSCEDAGMHMVLGGNRLDLANPDHRMMALMGAVTADREARGIKQRNRRTVRLNAEAGRPHGRLPYGYRRIYDERTGALVKQVPDEAQAKVLREASKALLGGETLRGVCAKLNAEGVPTPRRARKTTPEAEVVTRWEPSTLRQLLLKPTNAGLRQFQGKEAGAADWEAVIPEGEWRRLRALLTDPRRLSATPRGTAPRHLLSSIAVCEECGGRVKAATNMSRLPRAYVCRNEGCMRVTVSADRADEVVTAVLLAYLERDDVRAMVAAQNALREDSGEAAAALAHLEELRARLDEAAEKFANGELSGEMLAKVEGRLLPKIAKAEKEAGGSVVDPAVGRLITAGAVRDAWERSSLMDQRAVVRTLFRVTLRRATVKGRKFDHRRVQVELTQA